MNNLFVSLIERGSNALRIARRRLVCALRNDATQVADKLVLDLETFALRKQQSVWLTRLGVRLDVQTLQSVVVSVAIVRHDVVRRQIFATRRLSRCNVRREHAVVLCGLGICEKRWQLTHRAMCARINDGSANSK